MKNDHDPENEVIEQNHERGPGLFLKISYVVITVFCIYYAYAYWNWQSSYDRQQTEISVRLQGK
jgi:hypothetical protein